MSARQADSLGRVGRLRAGIVTTLRRSFPEMADKAEKEMGRRLAEVDDEILLTFIDTLTASAVRQEERTALMAIATALVAAGVEIDLAAHPSTWVTAIRKLGNEHQGPVKHPSSPTGASHTPQPVVDQTRSGERTAASQARKDDEAGQGTGDVLGEMFTIDGQRQVRTEGPLKPLSALIAEAEWPEDVIPVPSPEMPMTPDSQEASATSSPTTPEEGSSLADLFGGILWEGDLGDPAASSPGWAPSPVRAQTETTKRVPPQASAPNAGMSSPVRPELFPTATKGKGGKKSKTVRVSAEPAYPYGTEEAPEVLDDSLRQALLAASAIPRPVFTRDLVSIAGSPELVAVWEDECRSTPDSTPVRFVAPKQRHKLRGSLVVPDESIRAGKHRDDDWWNRCIDLYRAARLYEMGVLLHRIGDELVSAKFTPHHALLRLNSTRGLVGIIVSADDRLEAGEPARAELAASLGELLRERLTLVAVLTSAGEERELERLITAVLELSKEHAWDPSFPVVASRSWEYADDRGSTSRLVLGG